MFHELYHSSVQEGRLRWTLRWGQGDAEVQVDGWGFCFAKKCFDPGDYSEQQSVSSPPPPPLLLMVFIVAKQ